MRDTEQLVDGDVQQLSQLHDELSVETTGPESMMIIAG
jgi:hypothetical protein